MALTTAELASYHDKGYIITRGLFPARTLRALADEIDGLHERMATDKPDSVGVSWEEGLGEGRAPRIRQLMHSQKVSPILDAISRSNEVLDVVEQLIGPDIYLFHSKLMMKAAHDGTFTPWHQDWGYWRRSHKEPTQVNCMLAIDPADEANGAIRFVEGSHKQGPIDHTKFQFSSFNIGLDGDLDAFDATLLEMQPGEAVFFGPLVIHGSGPNTSAQDRRANTFAFDRPDALVKGSYPEDSYRRGQRKLAGVA